MENKYTSLQFFTRIKPIERLNSEFALCKVYVHGVGKNRNYSFLSKDNSKKATPTLSYVPVVGHLIPKYDDDGKQIGHYFGGHDYEITEDWELKSLTVPFGVVVEDSFNFEFVDEYGKQVEYLTANAILWVGRYPELAEAIYSETTWFNQSMEIVPTQWRTLESDSNFTEILDWTYSALCILGKSDNPDEHTEPCFISSQITPIDYSIDKTEFSLMKDEMRKHLAFYYKTINGKGEQKLPKEIFEEDVVIPVDDAGEIQIEDHPHEDENGADDFESTSEATEEAIQTEADDNQEREVIEELDEEAKESEEIEDPDSPEDFGKRDFSATYEQKRKALAETVSRQSKSIYDDDGSFVSDTYFYVCDFDDEYVYVVKNTYTDEGSGEAYGRYPYNMVDATATLTADFELMIVSWLTVAEKAKLDASREMFEELVKFKESKIQEDYLNAINDIIVDFEDLNELEEFKALVDKASEIKDLEIFKEKCFAIRGKHTPVKFAKEVKKANKMPLTDEVKDSRYGNLFAMYGKK